MPELPEVETVCRGLRQSILNKKITKAQNFRPNLRIPFPANFSEHLKDKTVKSVGRRAKYIIITLDDDSVIIAHLGMSGKMIVHRNFQNRREKHDHAIFQFEDGMEMVFNDTRRFGLITFSDIANLNSHKLIANLGLEPLEEAFNGQSLYEILKNRSTPIKNTIMDASLIVGVGNIYACEALFRSRINPTKKSNTLTEKQCEDLALNIKKILLEAIESGGSTLRDYVQSSGGTGYFQHNFKVYGRGGEPCNICENELIRIKQSGRSTFYCRICQK
ncbi:MAG: bifunctional DNA-formamidopyrimidine glycosylase/DNA-(apurinic or apyrimidinic site) lyase [Rickettsiales bacterium]|nr:bifunctional DNA-formamidopyrimidine glycosylase/DNA-(apurinic or apyrimidinic site) lyase [Pseudomonadota bacterium]MDA0967418.1 bifunctional DNA-formamidopyrimidine glycosylase/DNA-(apurinic or apyrimidinic site) lyase [Pseudomonadota bacterium]MDG4544214.1 bifunctional DNA-formamidopyrimidine glycosylase/DNA-(apurinic or apyrimidinic site) lyase [Rickettsiales bacterium]MDG4546395.1 bifunctional DNA-formamidopyrimidine glycosylase/DNA-(apurinic or apyrimidinic site) lyase [Rickettsiales ba